MRKKTPTSATERCFAGILTAVVFVSLAALCRPAVAQDFGAPPAPAPATADVPGDTQTQVAPDDAAAANQPVANPAPAAEPLKRDPFWPVGFRPGAQQPPVSPGDTNPVAPTNPPPVEPSDWPKAEAELARTVTSIVEGPSAKTLAVVNGQVVGAGETVSVVSGKRVYVWTVKSLSKKDGLKLNRQSARLVIGARKPALPAVATENWPLAEIQLQSTTIIVGQGDKTFAMVNDQVVKGGETVSATNGNYMYVWTVGSISKETGVELKRQSATRLSN